MTSGVGDSGRRPVRRSAELVARLDLEAVDPSEGRKAGPARLRKCSLLREPRLRPRSGVGQRRPSPSIPSRGCSTSSSPATGRAHDHVRSCTHRRGRFVPRCLTSQRVEWRPLITDRVPLDRVGRGWLRELLRAEQGQGRRRGLEALERNPVALNERPLCQAGGRRHQVLRQMGTAFANDLASVGLPDGCYRIRRRLLEVRRPMLRAASYS